MARNASKRFTPGRGALVTLVLVAMLNVMGGAAVAPALPAISEAYPEASEAIVSLVITLPSLAVALSGLFVGVIADRVGKARTLVISLAVFTAAGLWGLAAPTLEALLVGRFVLGIAIAGIATTSAALASEYYDESTRAKVFSWQSAASGASVLVLETSGGFLSLLGWRAPFLVYIVGFVLLALAAAFIREARRDTHGHNHPSDSHPGSEGEGLDAPSAHATTRAAKTAAFVLAACLAGAFLSQTLSYLVPSKMPYLVTAFGQSSLVSGLFLGCFGIANIVGPLASARLQQRVRHSLIAAGCFTSLALGCALMAIAAGVWMVLAGAVFIGLGVGCVTPLLMALIAARSTPENSGKHMGALATACNLGQFACTLLSGSVMALAGTHQAVFAVAAGIGIASAAASLALRRKIDGC